MQFVSPKKLPAKTAGYLVIQSDDTHEGDWFWFNKLERLNSKYTQFVDSKPLKFGCNTNSQMLGVSGFNTAERLKAMYDAGTEINNHCRYHISLGKFYLTQQASAGTKNLYLSSTDMNNCGVTNNQRSGFLYEYTLSNGTNSETVHFASFTYPQYITTVSALQYTYPVGSSLELTVASRQALVEGCQSDLEAMEIEVGGFCYPYHGGSDINPNPGSVAYIASLFDTARGKYGASNDVSDIDWTCLKSFAIRPNGEPGNAEIDEILDDTVTNNYLTMIYGHGETDAVTQGMLEYAIGGAISRGITILSQKEAFDLLS